MALSDLPCVRFNADQDLTKQQLCAILLIEAALSSIHPTNTGTVGDYLVQTPPDHVLAMADPPISPEIINQIREGKFIMSGDVFSVIGSWSTFASELNCINAKNRPCC